MTDRDILFRRLLLAGIGALAGLSFWLLFDILGNKTLSERTVLGLAALSFGFFGPLLAMIGPLRPVRAVLAALAVTWPGALLFLWASFRFDRVDDYLGTGWAMVAYLTLIWLPLPFLVSVGIGRGWRDYPTLFLESWGIVVRYSAAWIFVGLFWLVLMLSDRLLQLVDVAIIQQMISYTVVSYVLTGMIFGLAIAVVDELSDYISPNLILRLLRLLLPLVLVIVTIFILAIPTRGLTGLFGGFSVAATLLAVVAISAALITTVLDVSDMFAARSAVMRGSARALALLMPAPAGLAAYAVWFRLADYGWSPNRLAAALIAAIGLGYATFYALSALRSARWKQSIRRTNRIMAIVVIIVAALWLSPFLNPERISANSQIARYQAGRVKARDFDVVRLNNDWGRAGRRVADDLATGRYGAVDPAVLLRLSRARTVTDQPTPPPKAPAAGSVTPVQPPQDPVQIRRDLQQLLRLQPRGEKMAMADFDGFPPFELARILAGCKRRTAGGNPGCLVITQDFLPLSAGDETVVFYLGKVGNLRAKIKGRPASSVRDLAGDATPRKDGTFLDAIFRGGFSMSPVRLNALRVNDAEIFIVP